MAPLPMVGSTRMLAAAVRMLAKHGIRIDARGGAHRWRLHTVPANMPRRHAVGRLGQWRPTATDAIMDGYMNLTLRLAVGRGYPPVVLEPPASSDR